ncbi:oxygenase MpaB family protein [Robbsia andropogonis]|uniref:oxygenase MpaB family protein n=1 Tax=Robbsia andropogonis TaxID=28092 RepID=UPI000465EE93|nr:oxygenase MpaB family protein [Robbsia andropogonis]MCP1117045.1 oxygenase MpaB family protein [Robbsia andropogonis]MCP1128392.1 oxygenase MpaB family protein [Robbsia andropogonis]
MSASEFLRQRIVQGVNQVTTDARLRIDYTQPPGDPGLYGPDTVCWQVHADFTSMLVGGVAALLLQMLHPLALAGVWDHSTFREDIHGRLGRTATFIAATTFGGRADALAMIERVKAIHRRVTGIAPDGRPYAADDPDLLTWVHVAEMSCFLHAYTVYVNPSLTGEEQDRYYAETALVTEMLGGRGVPRNRAEVDGYITRMRPLLRCDERTREVLDVLMHAPAPNLATWPAARLLLHAGPDLLPPWAKEMFGLQRGDALRRMVLRPSVHGVAKVMRWALTNGVSKRARARVATGDGG